MARAAIVSGLGLVTFGSGLVRPVAPAGVLALIVMTADLAAADARMRRDRPAGRAGIEARSRCGSSRMQERKHPRPGPFRIHRMPAWHPSSLADDSLGRPRRRLRRWERDTLQPKYGVATGVEYTHTFGVGQLYDYDWFFDGFPWPCAPRRSPIGSASRSGRKVIYFPRRSFDFWNTRYFVIPSYPHGWRDPLRGYASFLLGPNRSIPRPGDAGDPAAIPRGLDWQIPVVQLERAPARLGGPCRALARAVRRAVPAGPQSIDAGDDLRRRPIWHDATMRVFDPRALAWVDRERNGTATLSIGATAAADRDGQVSYPSRNVPSSRSCWNRPDW